MALAKINAARERNPKMMRALVMTSDRLLFLMAFTISGAISGLLMKAERISISSEPAPDMVFQNSIKFCALSQNAKIEYAILDFSETGSCILRRLS